MLSSLLQTLSVLRGLGLSFSEIATFLATFGPAVSEVVGKLKDADTIKSKVLVAVEFFRKVAALTDNTADDAVLAVLDKVGVETAADLFVAILARLGITDDVEPDPDFVMGASQEAAVTAEAEAAGLNPIIVISAVQAIISLLRLFGTGRKPREASEAAPAV